MLGIAAPLGIVESRNRLRERDLRVRPMDEQKIDLINTELAETVFSRALQIALTELIPPNFGGQKDFTRGTPERRRPSPTASSFS